ncbi:MAG: protein kinase, partial [Proteobacteria bacterium]|nr:protein kinase [Pseudomonadota bacterium]
MVHRDLSSNNILLRGNVLAKVTDFGMAKLGDLNTQATRYTFTMCPGTDVYMPPETVKDDPVYTEKIDCFSFGVIVIQTLTRLFPKPGNRHQEVEINHPGLPRGTVEVRLAEVDRRQNHISQVDSNHPLLSIALNCLKDKDTERPSAQQLCERVANLKGRPEYGDSVAATQQESQQLRQLLQQIQQLHRDQTQQIVQEKEGEVAQLRQQLESYQMNQEAMIEKERDLQWMRQQMESSERERANLEKRLLEKDRQLRIHEPEARAQGQPQLRSKDKNHQEAARKVDRKKYIKLAWRKGKKAPFKYRRLCDAVVDGSKVYFQIDDYRLYTYNVSDNSWSYLPNCPFFSFSLAILNGQLTTIGGDPLTNKLMSFTDECKWIEKFPPMPTKRMFTTAVCTGTVLLIAGGVGENLKILATVEVLNLETSQWS